MTSGPVEFLIVRPCGGGKTTEATPPPGPSRRRTIQPRRRGEAPDPPPLPMRPQPHGPPPLPPRHRLLPLPVPAMAPHPGQPGRGTTERVNLAGNFPDQRKSKGPPCVPHHRLKKSNMCATNSCSIFARSQQFEHTVVNARERVACSNRVAELHRRERSLATRTTIVSNVNEIVSNANECRQHLLDVSVNTLLTAASTLS